jgi:hypothetical protein
MIASREAVITAIEDRLRQTIFARSVGGVKTFKSISRRLVLWADCPKGERPALYITDHNESTQYKQENNPGLTTMRVDLYIYIDSSDMNSVPSTDINTILDAVETALAPMKGMEQKQTLGGLVSHCRIEGEVLKDPGDLDGDGLLMIPISVMST